MKSIITEDTAKIGSYIKYRDYTALYLILM